MEVVFVVADECVCVSPRGFTYALETEIPEYLVASSIRVCELCRNKPPCCIGALYIRSSPSFR